VLAVVGAIIVVAALLVLAFFGRLLHTGVVFAGKLAGYDIAYGGLTNRAGRLTLTNLAVRATGREPLLVARRVTLDYDLGRVFSGPYPYGISRLELDRPSVTVLHRADGSYNFVLPPSNGKPAGPPAIPKIHLVVLDGALAVSDATRLYAHSRRLAVRALSIDADLDPKAVSALRFALTVDEAGGKFPLAGRGTFDERRGYESARLRGKTIALGPLIDYALNSSSLHVAGGVLNDLDARVYGLVDRGGTMRRHLSVTANLDHFQPYLNGLVKPLRDGRGSLRVYDDGLAIPKVDGSIAGIPVRISGAIYDLARPVLRLGIVGEGDLRKLVTLNDAAKALPISGNVRFALFVEGDATQPTTLATFSAPRVSYAHFPIEGTQGLVALHGQDTSILRTALGYDGATLGARGNLHVERRRTAVDILANLDAPLERVPYAASLVGPLRLQGDAVLAGVDKNALVSGVLAGASPRERLSGTFAVHSDGTGTVGPIVLAGPGSRALYLRVALARPDRGPRELPGPSRRERASARSNGPAVPATSGAAFITARDFTFSTAGPQPALPGLRLPGLPLVSGTLDARLAGTFTGKRFAFGGDAHAFGVRAFGYPIDDVSARLAVEDGGRLAVAARYRGSLEPLAQAAGGKLRAGGRVDVPLALVARGPGDVLAQIHDARFDRATVAGLNLTRLEVTVRLRGKTLDLYGADLRAAGSDLTARGSLGDGGTIDVSSGAIDLRPLRAAGLPVRGGSLAAVAAIGGSFASPHVEGGLSASGVRLAAAPVASVDIDGSTGLTYDSGRLAVHDAVLRAGPTVTSIDGSVAGLRTPNSASYDFAVHLREADIATLAALARSSSLHPEGSLAADVRVRGTAAAPRLRGRVSVIEGSLNGLRYRDASVALAGGTAGIHLGSGRVTVGGSTLGFSADVTRSAQSFALHAPEVRLSDFNDYFDAGDTLGGTGSIDLAARNEPDRIVSSGRIRLAHTRIHRFDIGDSRADWSTSGRTIRTDLAVGSGSGRIAEDGDIVLPATRPLRDALHRTSLALGVRATDISLERWLPVTGIAAPVAGLANASATIRGSYPNIAVVAHADLVNGRAGRVAIRTATLDARAANGRATVTSSAFAIDNLTATLTGSAGLTPHAPIDFTLSAQTQDVGALAKTISAATFDTSGALHTTAHLTGTVTRPAVAGTLDGTALRYGTYTLPRAHAEVALTQTRASLSAAEIDLVDGRILARGFAPLQFAPAAGIAPASAPLGLELTAERIDFTQFAALLPKGTHLGGELDGRVNLAGSLANPGVTGTLAVTNGSFAGPQERSRIEDFVSQLTFAGRTATLHDTSAKVGGGTVDAHGTVTVPDYIDPAGTATANLTLDSRYAVVDIPALFKGRINGAVTFTRSSKNDALLAGNLALTSARVPTTALLPKSGGATPGAAALPLALHLGVTVGSDVRVQGGPVDIGAMGDLNVGGTLASPTVQGELDSTGGTLSFYRTFTLGYPTTVTFDGSGVIPNVDAIATTTVDNPPTDVTLRARGPATHLDLTFESNPSYSREQIVGILVGAQALGAVSGIANVPGAQGPQQNPFTAAAEGQLGTLLTQNLFEPFSSQLGGAVGLNNLSINYTPGGSTSVGAQKKIFKNVSAVFAESFNYPQRQSIGLLASPSPATAAQLTFFSQPQSNRFNTFEGAQSLNSTNNSVTGPEPANGANGFSFSLQRKF
jgi:autotransporter translocation and assembly factor TamB